MVSIHKLGSLMSCSVLLCLGQFNGARATDEMIPGQPERQGGQAGLRG